MTSEVEQHGTAQKQHFNRTQYPTEYKITSIVLSIREERTEVGQRGEETLTEGVPSLQH